jgi:multimeric flavodoxin WrbA
VTRPRPLQHRVLGIATSPRRNGNSERLLDAVLEGAEQAGAQVTKIALRGLSLEGCRECGGCDKTGRCVVQDDMQTIYTLLKEHDRLVFATPIYFLTMCAQAKAMIDRGQAPWVLTARLKRPFAEVAEGEERKGLLVSCGGSNAKDLFACTERTFRAFLAVIDMNYAGCVCIPRVDALRAIDEHPTALEAARRAGTELAR